MKVEDLARLVDVDPRSLEIELDHVKQQYESYRDFWNRIPHRGAEFRMLFESIHKDATHLNNLIERECHPFLQDVLAAQWEPNNTTIAEFLSMLKAVAKYAKQSNSIKPEKTREDKKHKKILLNLLQEAWGNLTGKPADTSARFQEFLNSSCDYMGIDNKRLGLWERHRKQHAKRHAKH